jgi:uncharacterized membrane protein
MRRHTARLAVLSQHRAARLLNVALLGTWSPLARMPDILTISAIVCAYTAWAIHDPGRYISGRSIFAELSGDWQILTMLACVGACVAAYAKPFVGGWAALILGLGLRLYDAAVQHSPIGIIVYGAIFLIGALRLVQRKREADLTHLVVAEAMTIIRERAFIDAIIAGRGDGGDA